MSTHAQRTNPLESRIRHACLLLQAFFARVCQSGLVLNHNWFRVTKKNWFDVRTISFFCDCMRAFSFFQLVFLFGRDMSWSLETHPAPRALLPELTEPFDSRFLQCFLRVFKSVFCLCSKYTHREGAMFSQGTLAPYSTATCVFVEHIYLYAPVFRRILASPSVVTYVYTAVRQTGGNRIVVFNRLPSPPLPSLLPHPNLPTCAGF